MESLKIEIIAVISGLEKSLNAAQAKLEKFGKAASDLGASLSKSLTLPIVGLGVASLKAFGDIQALKNGLTAVTGSAGEAEKQFARLQILAKLPGLGLPEVAKGSINLQTIGFSAEKAEKAMGAFGNAVATVGKGRDEFERAIYGLQQLANTDFPLGEDLNILKDAIPQVTPLLKEAFGTARTADLQKLGITSAQVVDTIINGLSKLPPVTGGINGAFENLSDGVKSNLSDIGESIDQAFDISGVIDSLISNLSALTKSFKELSPATQKTIFIIAGIAAAIGPVLAIIGLITTSVIPALIAGVGVVGGAFAAITGPIALIAVAIGAAAYLIIKNWDKIVAYFKNGDGKGVFDSLIDTFSSAITFIKTAWAAFTKLLKTFWDKWGTDIIAIAKFCFDLLSKYFKIVFDVIGGIFKAGTAILTGNWSELGNILVLTTKKVWNGILAIIVDVVKAAAGLAGKLFSAIGLDSFGKKLDEITKNIADIIKNKFSFAIPVELDAKDNTKTEDKNTDTGQKKADTNVKKLGDSASKVKDIYKSLNTELAKSAIQFGATHYDVGEADVKSYQSAINSLIELGYKPESKAIVDLIDKQKQFLDLRNTKAESNVTLQLNPKIVVPKKIELPKLNIGKYTNELSKEFEDLSKTILNSGIQDAFASLATSMGSALAGGGNVLETLGSSLLSIVGGIATQLGKAAVGIGVAMIGIKHAFTNPVTAIAAGIALIALGSFISSKVANITKGDNGASTSSHAVPIRQFANGGIISGPTVGLMGEYAGARSNPEVVAPLDKLKGMISGGAEQQQIIPDLKLRGEDIYVSFKRVSKRLGGVI